jgi:hypothetical protein
MYSRVVVRRSMPLDENVGTWPSSKSGTKRVLGDKPPLLPRSRKHAVGAPHTLLVSMFGSLATRVLSARTTAAWGHALPSSMVLGTHAFPSVSCRSRNAA